MFVSSKRFTSNTLNTTVSKHCEENDILAHRIRISEILPWERKSHLTHTILTRTSSSLIK